MNKELQDLVWSVLPKEFKEEVKKEWHKAHNNITKSTLEYFFGKHNLTSDAGEDEMLTVPRKTVQDFFMNFKREKSDAKSIFDKISLGARMSMLQELFGSKCLPDEKEIAENANCSEPNPAEPPNIDNLFEKRAPLSPEVEEIIDKMTTEIAEISAQPIKEYFEKLDKKSAELLSQNSPENCDNGNHISTDGTKPAEPKFKVGDKVKDISSPHDDGIYKVDDIKKSSNGFVYHIQGLIGKSNVKESDLEPYAEPTDHILQPFCQVLESAASTEPTDFGKEVNFPTKKQSRNLSQDCDKHFDNILKDGFSKERRLNIAAQIARTLIQGVNFLYSWSDEEIKGVAHNSMRIADALIAECQFTDKLKGE